MLQIRLLLCQAKKRKKKKPNRVYITSELYVDLFFFLYLMLCLSHIVCWNVFILKKWSWDVKLN